MDLLVFFQDDKKWQFKIREFESAKPNDEAPDSVTDINVKHYDGVVQINLPYESFMNLRQHKLTNSKILNIAHPDAKAFVENVHKGTAFHSEHKLDAYPKGISVQFNEKVINEPQKIPVLIQSNEIIVDSYIMRFKDFSRDPRGEIQYGGRFFDSQRSLLRAQDWKQGTIFDLANSFHPVIAAGGTIDLTESERLVEVAPKAAVVASKPEVAA